MLVASQNESKNLVPWLNAWPHLPRKNVETTRWYKCSKCLHSKKHQHDCTWISFSTCFPLLRQIVNNHLGIKGEDWKDVSSWDQRGSTMPKMPPRLQSNLKFTPSIITTIHQELHLIWYLVWLIVRSYMLVYISIVVYFFFQVNKLVSWSVQTTSSIMIGNKKTRCTIESYNIA